MKHHAMHYGSSYDRDAYKLPIIEGLAETRKVYVANRFRTLTVSGDNVVSVHIYSHPVFRRRLSDREIAEQERWLGVSFLNILRYWYNWDPATEADPRAMRARYEAIAKYVMFWRDFFRDNRIDSYTAALESTYPEVTGLEVAKKLGLPIANIGAGRLTNSFMVYDERFLPVYWRKLDKGERDRTCDALREKYLKKSEPENARIQTESAEYTSLSLAGLADKTLKILRYFKNYHRDIVYERYRTNPPSTLVGNFAKHVLRKRYAAGLFTRPDYSKSGFFFYPMQYADEAATTYLDGFTDQLELIEHAAKCLPHGTKLIVKLHPHYRGMDVPLGTLKRLEQLPGVVLIDPSASSYDLIKHCIAVLSISSTVGFEALALGKPVISFGHDSYAVEGVSTIVRSRNELPEVMLRASEGKLRADHDKVRDYLASYCKNLIPLQGNLGHRWKLAAEDGRAIAEAIEAAEKEVKS